MTSIHSRQRSSAALAGRSNPFFHTPEQRVDEARTRFFEHGLRPSGLVSEPVLQSWARCLKLGRLPTETPVFEPVHRHRLAEALDRNEHLLRAAGPELDQLELSLAGTGCKTMLIDRRGIVVRSAREPCGHLLDVSSRLGVDLSEASFGSTAPGIAAKDDILCQVAGNEHFHGVLRQIHCVAAPVHNRLGQVVGVLDVSVDGQAFAFDALSMVRMSALAIENRLLSTPGPDECVVAFQTRATLLDTPLVALAGIDASGRVSWANPAAQALLPVTTQRVAADIAFGVSADTLRHWAKADEPPGGSGSASPVRSLVLPPGLLVWVQVRARAAAARWHRDPDRRVGPPAGAVLATPRIATEPPPVGAAPAAMDTGLVSPMPAKQLSMDVGDTTAALPASVTATSLDAVNRAVIEATLARHRGNVSRAARELGVSRGLLYRRLRSWQASGEPPHRA